MRKKTLLLICAFLLLLAGGAAYSLRHWVSTAKAYEVDVAPPVVEPRGQFDFPKEEFSILSLKVEVPIAVLASLANQNLPTEISGEERKNFHKSITNSLVQYRIVPGQLALREQDQQIHFDLPLQGLARVSGEIDARILRLPIQGGAEIVGSVFGSASPMVGEDWLVVPNLNPSLNLSQATLILGRLGSIDATSLVQQMADPVIKKEAAKLNEAIDIKPTIQKFWDEAHLNHQLSTDPEAWIQLDPSEITIGSLDFSSPGMVALTCSMKARSRITSAEGNMTYPEVLPKPVLTNSPPPTDARIPVIANLRMVNEKLKDQVFREKGKMGASLEVSEPEIRLGQDGMIYVGMRLDADSGSMGYKLKGKLWIQGKPHLDVGQQTISFREIALTPESMAAFPSSAAKLINRQLAENLTRELVIDLKKEMPEWEQELQKQISKVSLPEGVSLIPGPTRLRLLDIYTVSRPEDLAETAPGLVVVVGIQTDITARITKL